MKLHEIVTANENEQTSILVELLVPYKKQLLTYYNEMFNSEPMLMVIAVSNAVQYAKIVPSNEFGEAVYNYTESLELNEEDKEAEAETISFNSIPLSEL